MTDHIVARSIIITGPTGVGKTELSLAIGDALHGEIINADMGQCYTPLTIGTAKPDWQAQPIPHHLFDVIDRPEHLNSAVYRDMAQQSMQEIAQRAHVPCIVGGSGFYIHGLLFAPCVHTKAPAREYTQSTPQLWRELAAIDSRRAAQIACTDRYRIMRALDIWHGCGVLPSHCAPTFKPLARKTVVLMLTRSIDELYERIDQRVMAMLQAGWLDEVRALDAGWHAFLQEKKLIGYDDLEAFVRSGAVDDTQLIQTIQQKTRNYAKRQMTYLRMLARVCQPHSDQVRVVWVNMQNQESAAVLARVQELMR